MRPSRRASYQSIQTSHPSSANRSCPFRVSQYSPINAGGSRPGQSSICPSCSGRTPGTMSDLSHAFACSKITAKEVSLLTATTASLALASAMSARLPATIGLLLPAENAASAAALPTSRGASAEGSAWAETSRAAATHHPSRTREENSVLAQATANARNTDRANLDFSLSPTLSLSVTRRGTTRSAARAARIGSKLG
jgi:hypothetical protein